MQRLLEHSGPHRRTPLVRWEIGHRLAGTGARQRKYLNPRSVKTIALAIVNDANSAACSLRRYSDRATAGNTA